MRSSLDYAGFAQLCRSAPIMRKIMRAHNRIIPPSLVASNVCAIDLSKAFDKVHNNAHYIKLIKRKKYLCWSSEMRYLGVNIVASQYR